jgi:hypothetical protein
MFACALVLTALAVGGVLAGATVLSAIFGVYARRLQIVFGARLFAPHAYETELSAEGFRVHDSFGRVVHDVAWNELAGLKPVVANAPARPGGDILVGFDLNHPASARPRLLRRKGADGTLSDPYMGYEPVVQEMMRYIEAASGPRRVVSPSDLTPF